MIKDIFKDGLYYLLSKSFVGLLNVIIIWGTTKIYGINTYGAFSLTYILSLTISNLCFTWIAQSLIRMYQSEQQKEYIVKISFIFSAIVCVGILYLISNFYTLSLKHAVILAISNGIYSLGRSFLQSERKIRSFFYYDIVRVSLLLILTLLFSTYSKTESSLVYANALSCIIFMGVMKKTFTSSSIGFEAHNLKRWFLFGFPVALWLSIASGQLFLDRKIIDIYLLSKDTGSYAAIYDALIKVCALVVIPLSNACYPILVAKEKEIKSYRRVGLYMSGISLGLAALAFLCTLLLYPIFISIFPVDLTPVSLALLVFGITLWQLGMLYQKPLEMQKRTWFMLLNISICVLFSTSLNIFYVSAFGLRIFPISLALSSLMYVFLTNISIRK